MFFLVITRVLPWFSVICSVFYADVGFIVLLGFVGKFQQLGQVDGQTVCC